MGLAIDTVLTSYDNTATTAAGLSVASAATGDSLAVRSFDSPAWAKLVSCFLQGSSTPRQARVTSPRMHDNVTGFTFQTSESPSEFLFPSQAAQPLYSVDQLVVSVDAAASSYTCLALLNYYKDLQGINADLRSWSDIKGDIINYKSVEVAVGPTTAATWLDTVITTTENQLKADYKYAVLGFELSASGLLCAGIKGPATGNLRVCAPAASATFPITEYFIRMGEAHGIPFIPVFKANDRFNTYVSVAANAAVSANVYMFLAQLKS